MAKRLTDKEKKKIIAYYIECQNLRETARKFNVSPDTVKRITKQEKEIEQNLTQKKKKILKVYYKNWIKQKKKESIY